MRSMPRISSFRSMVRGRTTCLRLKLSSWRTSEEPRSIDFLISATQPRLSASTRPSRRSISEKPVIAVSRLLKSWAMPPASRPIASSFRLWWSCSCSCFWPVMSVMMPERPDGSSPSDSG